MLIVTAKLPRRKLVLGFLAAAALCGCTLLANTKPPQPVREVQATAAVSPKGIKTPEDRIAYLAQYGWQVDPEPLSVQELLIPKQFDESYAEYLSMQTAQGFDPESYAGKRVKRYTYAITNYPTGEQDVQVNLLLFKNTVIGGEVLCARLDGFLHGLSMPN